MIKKRNFFSLLLPIILLVTAGCKPVVVIQSPEDGSQFEHGAVISFVCAAFDLPKHQLERIKIVWISSRDGTIGTEPQCSTSKLSPGTHEITVKATDSSDWNGYDTVTIHITDPPPAPPTVSATSSLLPSTSTTTPLTSTTTTLEATTTLTTTSTSSIPTETPPPTTTTTMAWTFVGDADGARLNAVWGTPDGSDYFAVGDLGSILHYSRSRGFWRPMASNTGVRLNAVWGTSAQSVAAVGASSVMVYYDGETWSVYNGGGYGIGELKALWGISETDAFAAGESGIILHCRDISNPLLTTDRPWWGGDQPYDIQGLWGLSTDSMVAAGERGTMLHYNGFDWSPLPIHDEGGAGFSLKINSVLGLQSSGQIYAVGNESYFISGSPEQGFTTVRIAESSETVHLKSLWAAGETSIFAVGQAGTILHWNGVMWNQMDSGTSADLNSIWGSSDRDIFVVGDGIILRYEP